MLEIGVAVAPSRIANSFLEGKEAAEEIGFPLVIRPSYTLGGTGGGVIRKKKNSKRPSSVDSMPRPPTKY